MTRCVVCGFVAVCAMFVALGTPRTTAAPVPKGAGTGEATPDLKLFFDTADKAVKAEKWPGADDEKIMRWTPEKVFARALKAAEQKQRKLPVDFAKLKKLDVSKECKNANLESAFVIAGVVRGRSVKDSVIFATGDVEILDATNCVIVAPNVSCGRFQNCTVVAGECIRANSARPRKQGEAGSVLVAGQWIRARELDDAICHVLRPGNLPDPDEAMFKLNQNKYPAICTNAVKNVIFLNAMEDIGANELTVAVPPQNCTYAPPKNPIAK
jgi:hypothetical protein